MKHHYLIRFFSYCATSGDDSCAIKVYGHEKEFKRNETISEREVDEMVNEVKYHIKAHEFKREVFAEVFELNEIRFDDDEDYADSGARCDFI